MSFEKLVTRIAECGVCSTLKELNLEASANFNSDVSVSKFADILAIAPVLKECNISRQIAGRKVRISVEYATEGRKGAIVMRDKKTKQEILRRETDKKEAHHHMEI